MNNENVTNTFKKVQVKDYIRELVENGVEIKQYQKIVSVKAERGVVGQEVITVMANGLKETRNVVGIDEKTGKAGWIVTNPDGEQYIVPDSKFCERYDVKNSKDGVYNSKYNPINAIEINDDIAFTSPWGEQMNVEKGGYLVIMMGDDIYAIQKDVFYKTYQELNDYIAKQAKTQNMRDIDRNDSKIL